MMGKAEHLITPKCVAILPVPSSYIAYILKKGKRLTGLLIEFGLDLPSSDPHSSMKHFTNLYLLTSLPDEPIMGIGGDKIK